MKNTATKMTLIVLLFFTNIFTIFSQGIPDAPDGDGDPVLDPAPIDDFVWILIMGALLLGIFVFLKRNGTSYTPTL